MAIYCLINPDNTINRIESGIDPTVATRSGYKWLPLVEPSGPSYDPTIEVLIGPIDTVGATQVTRTWSKRSKTAQELDTDKQVKIDALTKLWFDVNFDQENRIRVLEGKSTITRTQYLNALKASV